MTEAFADATPLCVDLDGSLIRGDLLLESFWGLFRQAPMDLPRTPAWLARGRVRLKAELARRVSIDVATLPYHPELMAFLREAKAQGRPLILVTASHLHYAQAVASHLGLFDQVLASDDQVNLKGATKLHAIRELLGDRPFDYVGNSHDDLPVWQGARRAVVVEPEAGLLAKVPIPVARVFQTPASPWLPLRAIRIHQWLKNLLVLLPLVAAHRVGDPQAWGHALVAFVAFGCVASAGYLFNDLLDLGADRHHPRKRFRPLAAGLFSPARAMGWMTGLLATGLLLALLLPGGLFPLLGLYLVATLLYSSWLKAVPILDIMVIAVLYTLRVIAGGLAIPVPLSFWILVLSLFLFLSLAVCKRFVELQMVAREQQSMAKARGYRVEDRPLLLALGTASGFMAVLVLALYLNSREVGELYRHPETLWLLCLIFLYWIGYLWFRTTRDQVHDDPMVFAVTDRVTQVLAGVGAVILFLAV